MTRAALNSNISTNLASGGAIAISVLRSQLTEILDYLDQQDKGFDISGAPVHYTGLNLQPPFTEYSKTDSTANVRVAFGMLGTYEANITYNMDYTTGVHRLYDNTRNATWIAIVDGASNGGGSGWRGVNPIFAVQHCKASTASGDIWTLNGGNPIEIYMPGTASNQQNGAGLIRFNTWLMANSDGNNTYVGEMSMNSRHLHLAGDLVIPDYADNAAALSGGLVAGDIYKTTDTLKIVH
jgi:hypothetical protein